MGLKTAPCGTPAAIMNLRVIELLILTANDLALKNCLSQMIMYFGKLNLINL